MNRHSRWWIAPVLWTVFALSGAHTAAGSEYDELVALFVELREFQEPTLTDGVLDYTPAAIEDKVRGMKPLRDRLTAMDIGDWPVWQQADYHLVRAEMNAVEFHLRVYKPWARDPGFYAIFQGDAGPSMNLERSLSPLFEMELPLSPEAEAGVSSTLGALPKVYEQARTNLTDAAGDLAILAIRDNPREAGFLDRIAERTETHHPELAANARAAAEAIRDYVGWLEQNKDRMTAPAGVGKKHYSWWMRNVQLSPWGWEESNAIIQREYDRIITFLKLEEQRNRNLPLLDVAMSERAWEESLRESLHTVVDFLREAEIMTVPSWVDPSDYYSRGDDVVDLAELDDAPSDEFLPENSSIDTKVRQREILPGETHEYVGHMLDEQRHERQTKSRIRSARRRYNMGSMRLEGWAVALEELMMQAGVLDDRPRKGREMEYLMNASHMSLSIPDMKMHANEIDLTEARQLCAEIMPRGWSRPDERMVWFEMKSNLRNPGGFHSNVVTGKAYFMKLFREVAQEKGDAFVLREFIDEFLASGIIPMSLIRWEMTGNDDDIVLVTEEL